ncbi:MAG TPA: aspartate carbamoyltransferase catalytic subunit [Planktothrix sp.]|jgi:aspartate carbamoyltransferase catalytic subunit
MPEKSKSTPTEESEKTEEQLEREDSSLLPRDLPGMQRWSERRHLIDTKDLSLEEIDCIMSVASVCKRLYDMQLAPLTVLQNKVVTNVFYENSTRTRSSFEIAARKLGATVINLDIKTSSYSKGESLADTAKTLAAMGAHAVVQRHSASGTAQQLADALGESAHVINAGDGWNAHPTQALLDLFTMQEVNPSVIGCKVAIIGDILHSRVARSNIWLLQKLGMEIHVAGPPSMVPPYLDQLNVIVHKHVHEALEDADFVIALRLQTERQQQGLIPSLSEYKMLYRLDHKRMEAAKPGVRLLHPGPVNRGVEVTDALIDDKEISLVANQIANGVAVRMAVLYVLLGGRA